MATTKIGNRLIPTLWLLMTLVFVVGLAELFILRFEVGDVYPIYSSLRTDPLGTKAFYQGLEKLSGIQVGRHYRSLMHIDHAERTSVFYLGLSPEAATWPGGEAQAHFDQVAVSGGRLILTFYPAIKKPMQKPSEKDPDKAGIKSKPKPKAQKISPKDQPSVDPPAVKKKDGTESHSKPGQDSSPPARKPDVSKLFRQSLAEHWGLSVNYFHLWNPVQGFKAKPDHPGLPEIPWHSALYFERLNEKWQVLYTVRGKPVIIERPYGQGSIVMCADTYFMSNEAIKSEPSAALLTWLIGPNRRIVFDEAHFGVLDNSGVAGLARKYRLHGLLLGLFLLAGLFIWRNSSSLRPPVDSERQDSAVVVVSYRDYTAGLVSLLKRSVPMAQLLNVCWREWISSAAAAGQETPAEQNSVETLLTQVEARTDPVRVYREIHNILAEGKKTWNRTPTT